MTFSFEHLPTRSALALLLGCVGLATACTGQLTPGDGAGPVARGPSSPGAGTGALGPDGKPLVNDPTNPAEVARALAPKRESGLQRLSTSQYLNTITDLFSAAAAGSLDLEVDYRSEGFTSIAGRDVAISRSGVRKYEAAARQVAERVMADAGLRSKLASCTPSGPADTACMTSLVNTAGRRLFRRALTAEEAQRYLAVGASAASSFNDFWKGASFALTGLLLSPHFLHQVELGVERSGERVLSDLELATRLSYFLWDTVPDEALLSAAERGELTNGAGTQRARLLADDAHLSQGIRAFGEGLFALHRLDSAPQSGGAFPEATPALYGSMREALQLLSIDVAVKQRASFLSILEPGFAYVDATLSAFYGVNAPAAGFSKVALPPGSSRVGLLTEPAVLAATSRATQSSPTLRGIFVTGLVCYETPPPPANVNATLPERPEGVSRREQLDFHMSQPTCAACHKTVDPVGFGLERFNALGMEQATDKGAPLNTTGNYFETPFDGAAELSRLVKADPRLGECIARKAYMHGLARLPEANEDALIEPLAAKFVAGGHDLAALLGTVAESGLFQLAPKPSAL